MKKWLIARVLILLSILIILVPTPIPISSIQTEQQMMQKSASKIQYNGEEIDFSNGEELLDSYTLNNVTYVPLRYFANIMGKDVKWNSESMGIEISDMPPVDADGNEIGSYFKYCGIEGVSLVLFRGRDFNCI